jgi:hypothetical protein
LLKTFQNRRITLLLSAVTGTELPAETNLAVLKTGEIGPGQF